MRSSFITMLALILTMLLTSCSRDLTNPLDTDADLRQRPEIVSIELDIATGIKLQLGLSYSETAEILFERKLTNTFEPVACQKLTASIWLDSTLDLEQNHNLVYRVRIRKDEYTTDYSPDKSFVYVSTTINAPSGFTASSVEMQGIRLSWQDNSSIETGYRIEKNENNNGFTELANLPANTSTYLHTITGMPPTPIDISYRIKSFNNTLHSIWAENSVTYSGLGAPTDLVITDSTASHLTIAWTRNSAIATGYEIERKKDNGSFALIQTVEPSIQSYSDVITVVGTYAYRVRAQKDDSYSTYSNEASTQVNSIFPTDGLISYYPFNGNANDESGNGHHGTVDNAVPTADRFQNPGSSYQFNNNASITTGWMIPNVFSISIWYNVAAQNLNNTGLFSTYQGWDTNGCYYTAIPNWEEVWYDGNIHTNMAITNNVGRWTHAIIISSGSMITVYRDGFLETQVNGSTSHASTFVIGESRYNDRFFSGKIDDIRIYNRALTEAEIQALYHEGGWTGNP